MTTTPAAPAARSDAPEEGAGDPELVGLADEVTDQVRRWLATSATLPVDASAQHLAGVLKDPRGLDFTVGFVDGVVRPEDPRVAARNFAVLARDVPRFLPWHLRVAVRVGALAGLLLPALVIPVVRRALRRMVGHLVVDARDRQLGVALAKIRRRDVRLNINLLGEAVLGEHEAERRLQGTHRLLARDDVDYVSIKVSSTVAPHNPWAFDEAVDHVVDRLLPLFRRAAAASPQKFVNLDMEEYRDLELTTAVFTRILDREELLGLEAGIVLQAYLPDALAAMVRLQEWSAARVARGGAPVKVRVVKGANLPMERVEAEVHDWPLATWHTKQDSDTHYKRVLSYALHPERTRHVRVGVAGHNLFDIAFAWLLAGRRGVRDGIEFEMLLGMAQGQAEAVRRDVAAEGGSLLLYTPVVHPREFDVAIAYLIRRLEEGASRENFMSAVFDLHEDDELFERERRRFLASLVAVDDTVPPPHRTQDRRTERPEEAVAGTYRATPDTDPALPGNLAWGREILARVPGSALGADLVAAHTVATAEALEGVLARATDPGAGGAWGRLSGAARAAYLRRAAVELERRRATLLEVMASECGKTLDQGDPEVSEAVDFANYYAHLAEQLDEVDGAEHHPVGLTVVTPPWNFPVAIPAGSTLAALAAGSAVVVKPAPQAQRCGSVMVEALWAAGVPADALQLVHVEEGDLGRALVGDPRVDRLILTGAYDTAALFRSFRADLPLLAETSGKNALVVTPSADLDLAVKDLVASAFGHAGQKCSAASLAILVGSVARSRRFRQQLVDAVASLAVGLPEDPTSKVGPLVEPASGKLLRALTVLGPGESWVVEPRQLDDTGRLWSPGVKEGVARGSESHLTEYFGPVLGLMVAADLDEAVAVQNEVDYGLTAGLHSLDPDEVRTWLDRVEAGNVYVNRGTTGAIVQRQPFGGWKRSAVGAGSKAGGPHYLVGLSSWTPRPAGATAAPLEPAAALLEAAGDALGEDERASVARALRSDAAYWTEVLGTPADVTGLRSERNVLRHLPVPVVVRHVGGPLGVLVRVLAAGLVAGSRLRASVTPEAYAALPTALRAELSARGVALSAEDDAAWLARAASLGSDSHGARVRLVGAPERLPAAALALAGVVGARPEVAVWSGPVTEAGRVELLPFVHEQAISITAHRFGTPHQLAHEVL